MKSRLVASAAVSALVLLGATGCTFITPQSTKIEYSPSDGVNVFDANSPLDVRNVLIVASEDGSVGNVIAAVVNSGDVQQTLTMAVSGLEPLTVTVPANSRVSFGADAEPLRINDLDTMPGATVEMYFQVGETPGTRTQVPVLDGTLPYYADLVPDRGETVPLPTPEPEPTDTAAPAPTN